jgi:hypothetical protein
MHTFKTILILIIFICNISYSQSIVGKIYTNTEANTLYGPVLSSVPVSSIQLNNLTFQTTYYLMFRILNGNLTILGDKRTVLSPIDSIVNPQDVFRVLSVSLVQKVIKDGNDPMTYIEIRNNGRLTITNGLITLEEASQCPPDCY